MAVDPLVGRLVQTKAGGEPTERGTVGIPEVTQIATAVVLAPAVTLYESATFATLPGAGAESTKRESPN